MAMVNDPVPNAIPTGHGVVEKVVAMATADGDRLRLLAAFGQGCVLVRDMDELREAAARWCPTHVIVAADKGNAAFFDALSDLARRAVVLSILVPCTPSHLHFVLSCALAGANDVIVRGVDDDVTTLRRLFIASPVMAISTGIMRSVSEKLREPTVSLVRDCVAHSLTRSRADDVARRLGVSMRTATNWADDAGFKGVRAVISRARTIVALGLIGTYRLPVSSVAETLTFGSVAHLANTVRRCTGLSLKGAVAIGNHHFWTRRLLLIERSLLKGGNWGLK